MPNSNQHIDSEIARISNRLPDGSRAPAPTSRNPFAENDQTRGDQGITRGPIPESMSDDNAPRQPGVVIR